MVSFVFYFFVREDVKDGGSLTSLFLFKEQIPPHYLLLQFWKWQSLNLEAANGKLDACWNRQSFDILINFQYYYKRVSLLTARWGTYPSQVYRNTAVKIMLGVNLNVIVNSDSNLDQIVF